MNTTLPKEYLTLKSGETENYSEVYNKRLMQPNTCPNNGTRDDSCDCVADAQRREGLTTFHKVKINVTSLKINSKFYIHASYWYISYTFKIQNIFTMRIKQASINYISAHDFTFSTQRRGQIVPYGEAGDCYSTVNCPQGRFSINLIGTGLRVSPYTGWVGQGNQPSLWLQRISVSRHWVKDYIGNVLLLKQLI